tara:strand:- start:48 stop:443 length:396 start_codon:yes stop_codon:yes gene_type:complete
MMTSSQDFGRQGDIDAFIRKIKEQNENTKKFEGILKKMGNVGEKAENFLRENRSTNLDFMQEIPGYIDPRTGMVVREDQLAGLPFPYNPAGLPEDVYQATQRQYGKKIFGPYTTDDAKLIQQFFGNRKGLG